MHTALLSAALPLLPLHRATLLCRLCTTAAGTAAPIGGAPQAWPHACSGSYSKLIAPRLLQNDITFDCQATPGARCVKDPAEKYTVPECIAGMTCSPDGKVLVAGKPCAGVPALLHSLLRCAAPTPPDRATPTATVHTCMCCHACNHGCACRPDEGVPSGRLHVRAHRAGPAHMRRGRAQRLQRPRRLLQGRVLLPQWLGWRRLLQSGLHQALPRRARPAACCAPRMSALCHA
jgi:hypothetical protein